MESASSCGEIPKKRLVIDYSTTINRYRPHPDAYPLPLITDIVNNLAQYSVYSVLDLKSAYHQIPLLKEERETPAGSLQGLKPLGNCTILKGCVSA